MACDLLRTGRRSATHLRTDDRSGIELHPGAAGSFCGECSSCRKSIPEPPDVMTHLGGSQNQDCAEFGQAPACWDLQPF